VLRPEGLLVHTLGGCALAEVEGPGQGTDVQLEIVVPATVDGEQVTQRRGNSKRTVIMQQWDDGSLLHQQVGVLLAKHLRDSPDFRVAEAVMCPHRTQLVRAA
jgi:hypothetical protein